MRNSTHQRLLDLCRLLPMLGSMLFALLYIMATFYYPGGNYLDKNTSGFSWTRNYWCNLLNENAINGQHNPARPIALAAMTILCLTLIIFWWLFPKLANLQPKMRYVIQASGLFSNGDKRVYFYQPSRRHY